MRCGCSRRSPYRSRAFWRKHAYGPAWRARRKNAGRIETLIHEGLTAEAALEQTVGEFVGQFAELQDAYLKDRAADIKDIGQRLLRQLLGVTHRHKQFDSAVVLVATDIALSDLALV